MNSEIYFEAFSDTNSIGPFHKENEDSIFASKTDLVFAVADGVGGYSGAKEASEIAIGVIRERSQLLRSEEDLRSCVKEIDGEIKQRAKQLRHLGMGTTLALAKVLPEKRQLVTSNVGDSPIHKISNDVVPLYVDDSLRFEDPRNLWSINQYLGCEEVRLTVHTKVVDYSKGDILLLCSDGVSDNILGTTKDYSVLGSTVRNLNHARDLVKKAIDIRLKNDDMSAILVFL